MKIVKTLNKISPNGLALLDPAKYAVDDAAERPDAIIVRSADMKSSPLPEGLKAVGRAGAGVNNIPVADCTAAGVAVFNTPGANANAVKELVICGLLLASRKIAQGVEWEKGLKGSGSEVSAKVEKGKKEFVGPEIAGKTLGIIGLGAIGVLVANSAAALGMKIVGCDPFLTDAAAEALDKNVTIVADVRDVFAGADYITIHAPLNDSTRDTVRKETLDLCKDGVRVLNFARGELVNEQDIIDAVGSGKVAAYVTDFATDAQLCVDGIIAIPHLGASTPESEENCAVMAVNEIVDYLENGHVKNSVNLPNLTLDRAGANRLAVISTADAAASVTDALAANGASVNAKASASKKGVYYALFDTDDELGEAALAAVNAVDGVLKAFVVA